MEETEKKPKVVKTVRRVVRTGKVTRASNGGEKEAVALPPWASSLLKCILLDLPLLLVLGIFLAVNALLYWNVIHWFPQMQAHKWTLERAESELTYYDMHCKAASIGTATTRAPLVLSADQSARERANKVRLHGAGMVTNLFAHVVDDSVVQQFRSFALRKNQRVGNRPQDGVDVVGVIENNHRWSFAFEPGEDPSIAPLLESIGRHTVLTETLQVLLGENPSIVELSTITAERGAQDQGWHFDTSQEGDSLKFSNTFSDLYSLLIPVQDTTPEMGPTAICPGTHYCSQYEGCEEHGFSPVEDVWKAGDGLLFNSHLGHQGTAHVNGPTRVAIVISFVARPSRGLQLPLAAGYVIPWNAMGFTLADLADASTKMIQPWSTFRSLGFGETTGWDYFRFCVSHMANHRDPPQVVIMPYVKTLPIQLIGLANYHHTYSPWQVFVLDTLQRVWIACFGVYLLGLWVYTQVYSLKPEDATSTSKAKPTIGFPWARLLLLHASISMVTGLLVVKYPPSEVAQSRDVHTVVGDSNPDIFSEEYIQSLACPQAHDILMGRSFLEDFSKWSPGNRRWHGAAKELLPWFLVYSSKSDPMSCVLVDAVLEAMSDPLDGEESRVVLQNESSDWIGLSDEQAKEQSAAWLRRMLVHSPGGPCSGSKTTAICRMAYDLVDHYLANRSCSHTDSLPTRHVWMVKQPLGLPPKRNGVQSSIQSELGTQPKQPATPSSKQTSFQIGDYVEARTMPTTRKWLRGVVTEKRDGGYYMVRFDVDIPEYDLEDPLDASLLRPVKQRLETIKRASVISRVGWRSLSSKRV